LALSEWTRMNANKLRANFLCPCFGSRPFAVQGP
jgi:hypothetical protein